MVKRSTRSARAAALRRAAKRFPATFGDRLRSFREAAGFTQVVFAKRCGIAVRSLSRYECGMSEPGASVVLVLAAGLYVEPDELLGV